MFQTLFVLQTLLAQTSKSENFKAVDFTFATTKVMTSSGVEASVIVNFALKRSKINARSIERLDFKRGDDIQLKFKLSSLSLNSIRPEIVSFQNKTLNDNDIILGSDAFDGKIVYWNCQTLDLVFSDTLAVDAPGYRFNKESGTFKWKNKEWLLPGIIRVGFYPKKETKDGALSTASLSITNSLPEDEICIVMDHDRLRSVVYDPSGRPTEVTSSSFFGPQTIALDFKNSMIYFKSIAEDNFADTISTICGVRISSRDNKFYMTAWPDVFDRELQGNPEIVAVGNINLSDAFSRKLIGIRDLMSQARSSGMMTMRIDGQLTKVRNKRIGPNDDTRL